MSGGPKKGQQFWSQKLFGEKNRDVSNCVFQGIAVVLSATGCVSWVVHLFATVPVSIVQDTFVDRSLCGTQSYKNLHDVNVLFKLLWWWGICVSCLRSFTDNDFDNDLVQGWLWWEAMTIFEGKTRYINRQKPLAACLVCHHCDCVGNFVQKKAF